MGMCKEVAAGLASKLVLLIAAAALSPAAPRSIVRLDPYLRPPPQVARQFIPEPPIHGLHSAFPDPAGFIWIASDSGLLVFDGLRFHVADPLPCRSVAETNDGLIWFGGVQGLYVHENNQRRQVWKTAIGALIARREKVYIAADHLLIGRAGSVEEVRPSIPANGVFALDRDQSVWFGCGVDVCHIDNNEHVQRSIGLTPLHWRAAIRDDNGAVWAFSTSKMAELTGDGVAMADWVAVEVDPDPPAPVRLRDGRIPVTIKSWLEDGMVTGHRIPQENRLGATYFEDGRDNLWRISAAVLELLTGRFGVDTWPTSTFPNGCRSITRAANTVIASCALGLYSYKGKGAEPADDWIQLPMPESAGPVWSASPAGGDDLWVLATREISRFNLRSGARRPIWNGDPKGIDYRILFGDRTNLWVGAKYGLFRIMPSAPWLRNEALPDGGKYAVAFAKDQEGNDWLGTDRGILRWSGAQWQTVVSPDSLLTDRIRSLAVTRGPVFWVSYRDKAPFSRVQMESGQWKRQDFPAEAGYSPDESNAMLTDRRGWVWRGTPQGLFVSDGTHVGAYDWIRLDDSLGVPGVIGPFGLFEDTDGSIWTTGDRGVAHIRPDPNWFIPKQATQPKISAVRWNESSTFWPTDKISLTGRSDVLEIDFAASPDTSPAVSLLRYRLAGVDSGWQQTTGGRAIYRHLTAGDYRFEVATKEGASVAWEFAIENPLNFLWRWIGGSLIVLPLGWWGLRKQRLRGRRDYWHRKAELIASLPDLSAEIDRRGIELDHRFVVLEQCFEGGFATVWKAQDKLNHNVVAIKFLDRYREQGDWQKARFDKEVAALEQLRHPGIVRFLAQGLTDDGYYWLAMQWIDGPSLREILKSGPIPAGRAAAWISQTGDALAYAHARGILHRDLKPDNILIDNAGKPGEHAVLIDFGAATLLDTEDRARSALFLGAFDYMAPERIVGRSSASGDVYSLAAVFFEVLTGIRYVNVAADSADALARALSGYPEPVARVLADALSLSPENRPQSIEEFTGTLSSLLRTENPPKSA